MFIAHNPTIRYIYKNKIHNSMTRSKYTIKQFENAFTSEKSEDKKIQRAYRRIQRTLCNQTDCKCEGIMLYDNDHQTGY